LAAIFSAPPYPGAVSYDFSFSDPTVGDPNAPNPFGTWTSLASAVTSPSNIGDPTGDATLRLYRVRPNVVINSTPVALRWFGPFSATTTLFDPIITVLLPAFRDALGDYGEQATASTNTDLDTGAGVALLQPDGSKTVFNLGEAPDATPPVILESSVKVVQQGLTKAIATDYIVDWDNGTIIFAAPPAADDVIDITYTEVRYSNRMLNSALQVAIDSLATYKINGYSVSDDNNVKLVSGALTNSGLKPIVFAIGLKILNRAAIRKKSDEARAYKSDTFSYDTAPGRIIDGMSTQSVADFSEIRSMANKYIQTATSPTVRSEFDSWFDMSGRLPIFGPTGWALTYAGYAYYL